MSTLIASITDRLTANGYENVNPAGFDLSRNRQWPVVFVYGLKDQAEKAPANYSRDRREVVIEIVSGKASDADAENELEVHKRRFKQILFQRFNGNPVLSCEYKKSQFYVTTSAKNPRGLFTWWSVLTQDNLTTIEEMPA